MSLVSQREYLPRCMQLGKPLFVALISLFGRQIEITMEAAVPEALLAHR